MVTTFAAVLVMGACSKGAATHHYPAPVPPVVTPEVEDTLDLPSSLWTVMEKMSLHEGVKYFHCSFKDVRRHMHVLQIDLGNPNVEIINAYAQDQVPNPNANNNSNNGKNLRETVSEICSRKRSEGLNIVAGVNSGFFDSNDGISRGYQVGGGEPLYVPNPSVATSLSNHSWALTIFADGTASCSKKELTALLEAGGKEYGISSVNDTIMRHSSSKYELNMYTSLYKQYPHASRKDITNPLAKNVLYIVAKYVSNPVKIDSQWAEAKVVNVYDGRKTPLSSLPYLSDATQVGFAVSGSTAYSLASLKAGDSIRLNFSMKVGGVSKPVSSQFSSMFQLMKDGADASKTPGETNALVTKAEPRTFPVVSKDGKTLWIVEVDGRQSGYSEGANSYDMYCIAKELGGWNLTNFDGGGSSCMWIYDSSVSAGKTVNSVSDSKGERSCLNYLLVRLK